MEVDIHCYQCLIIENVIPVSNALLTRKQGKNRCLFLLQLKFIMFIEARIYIIHAFVTTMKSLCCAYAYVVFTLTSLSTSGPATVICIPKNLGEEANIDKVPSLFLSEHQY